MWAVTQSLRNENYSCQNIERWKQLNISRDRKKILLTLPFAFDSLGSVFLILISKDGEANFDEMSH